MNLNENDVKIETAGEEIVEHFMKTKTSLIKRVKNALSRISEREYYKLKAEILQTKDALLLSKLLVDVTNSKNPEIILDFAKTFGEKDSKLSFAMAKTQSAKHIYEFADKVENANVSILSKGMKFTQNPNYIFKFAKNIDGADIEELSEGMAGVKDPNHLYFFATFIKGANLKKISEGVANCGNAAAIYYFARHVKGADMDILLNGLVEMNDTNYIYKFLAFENSLRKQNLAEQNDFSKIRSTIVK